MTNGEPGLPGNSEDMAAFFDARAASYEQHMRETVEDFSRFYCDVADALPALGKKPRILDLGIGTGLELDRLFERFPEARVTGIDVSSGMLKQLQHKHRPWAGNLNLIAGSFLQHDLGIETYDAVVSSMALHHWIPEVKLNLYRRIFQCLKHGGTFVNGDYVVSEDESNDRLAAFAEAAINKAHSKHIDLPLSIRQERNLLKEAGFLSIATQFERTHVAILVALKH